MKDISGRMNTTYLPRYLRNSCVLAVYLLSNLERYASRIPRFLECNKQRIPTCMNGKMKKHVRGLGAKKKKNLDGA